MGYNNNSYRVLVSGRKINARHVQVVEDKTKLICSEKIDDEFNDVDSDDEINEVDYNNEIFDDNENENDNYLNENDNKN